MGQVVSRFRVLLAEKSMRERQAISLRDVARDTGISAYTLGAFANNTIREIPIDVMTKLCNYLGVTPGDLFVMDGNGQAHANGDGTKNRAPEAPVLA